MSSLFLWVTPVLLSKGQGIVQADVAESLADLTMCPHGGIPEHFYLDNGGEYSALGEAMRRLEYLAQDQFGLTLAKPYSPTSKGSIEGLFNILEQVFKGLPGWIGGGGVTTRKARTRARRWHPTDAASASWWKTSRPVSPSTTAARKA